MSRKKRRSRKRATAARRQAQAARRARAATPSVATAQEPQANKKSAGNRVDFAAEYHYVLSDLKRFAILAVAMFVTLIVLALVLG